MSKLRVTGRMAALTAVGAAAVTATLVVIATPAAAAPSGSELTSCTDQVRVRSQPNTTAPVVGSCKAGEKVTVTEVKDGFARLSNKQGWASAQYVKLEGTKFADEARSSRVSGSNKPSSSKDSSSDDEDDNDRSNSHDDDDSGGGLLGGL